MSRLVLPTAALAALLVLTGCSTSPKSDGSSKNVGHSVATDAASPASGTENLAARLPPTPAENPLCPVVASSGAVDLIGSSEPVWDKRSTVGYARCQSLDGRAGIVDVWVFPPDSKWGRDAGGTPDEYIRIATDTAPGSTPVASGNKGDEAWAEFLAVDGSRPMVDVIAKDGALIAVAITPIKGGPGSMDQVRTITAAIASSLDIPLTLAYAAAN